MLVRRLALSLALWCWACGGRSEPPVFSLTDSAGISVATSTAPLWETDSTAAWRLEEAPLRDLGRSHQGPEHHWWHWRAILS
jgi:hypothetical protein